MSATRTIYRSRAFFVVSLLVGASFSFVVAQTPRSRPSPALAADSDPMLALRARAALGADEELATLNLLVSVSDRVAVVGGPIPSESLIPTIEAALRTVTGLQGVKVSCWVRPPEDPLKDLVGRRLKAAAEPPRAAKPFEPPILSLNPIPPAPNRVSPTPNAVPPRAIATTAVPPSPSDSQPDVDPRPQGTVTSKRVTLFPFLLEPVVAADRPEAGMPRVPTSYPTIPPTALPVNPVGELEPYLAALKKREPRYAKLFVTLTDGTARISGEAPSDGDAWNLAKQIRAAAGIERVVVDRVNVR